MMVVVVLGMQFIYYGKFKVIHAHMHTYVHVIFYTILLHIVISVLLYLLCYLRSFTILLFHLGWMVAAAILSSK